MRTTAPTSARATVPTSVEDRRGHVHARLTWRGDELARLVVGGPGAWTLVGGARVAHPVFGEAHPIWIGEGDAPPAGDDAPATWMGAVAWRAPTTIPPIFAPAVVHDGAMILNVLAMLARAAGVETLRYAGPYPTAALWHALRWSFRVVGEADEAAFTADALGRAVRGDMTPIELAFAPAPFVRERLTERVTVQLRDGLERATIDGLTYDGASRVRRLLHDVTGVAQAWLYLGDRPWSAIALFDLAGELPDEVAAPRPVAGALASMLGAPLPPAMCAALADVVAELVAPPLAEAARAELAAARVEWGDPGAAEVVDRAGVLVVHAGLWAHLAPAGMGAVARGLAQALAAPIAARAQARLAAAL